MLLYRTRMTDDQVKYIAETVAPHGGTVTLSEWRHEVQLNVAAAQALCDLPDDCDGHVDHAGRLWIDGDIVGWL